MEKSSLLCFGTLCSQNMSSERRSELGTILFLISRAITSAHANFVASAHPVDLFNNLLNSILLVAESPYGFIGEMKQTPEGVPYLQTYAITNIRFDFVDSSFCYLIM